MHIFQYFHAYLSIFECINILTVNKIIETKGKKFIGRIRFNNNGLG